MKACAPVVQLCLIIHLFYCSVSNICQHLCYIRFYQTDSHWCLKHLTLKFCFIFVKDDDDQHHSLCFTGKYSWCLTDGLTCGLQILCVTACVQYFTGIINGWIFKQIQELQLQQWDRKLYNLKICSLNIKCDALLSLFTKCELWLAPCDSVEIKRRMKGFSITATTASVKNVYMRKSSFQSGELCVTTCRSFVDLTQVTLWTPSVNSLCRYLKLI